MTLEQLAQPRVPEKMVDLLIGMPTVDSIRTETVASMMNAIYPTLHDHLFLKSAVISDQRDRIGLYAINAKVRLFTHLLFIDSDITFPPEAIKKLINDDKDIVSGLYFKKNVNPQPVAWFTDWKNDGSVKFRPFTCNGSQELVECGAVGMGFCLIKTSVLHTEISKQYANVTVHYHSNNSYYNKMRWIVYIEKPLQPTSFPPLPIVLFHNWIYQNNK